MNKIFLSFTLILFVMSANAQSAFGFAPVNGLKMYYEVYGDGGVPLVLIHGGGSTIQSSFGRLIPLLSRHNKIIAVELQAHGRTNDRPGAESFEQDADDVAALLRYLAIDKADILGFSNGGSTTMQIAIRHPEVVGKIVVVSGVYRRDGLVPGFFDGMSHATIDNMPAELKEAYLKVSRNPAGLQVMFEKDRDRMIHFTDWSDEDIKRIKAPALIMGSDRDVVLPEHAMRISRLIQGAECVILPGLHGSVIGEVGGGPEGVVNVEVTERLVGRFLGWADRTE